MIVHFALYNSQMFPLWRQLPLIFHLFMYTSCKTNLNALKFFSNWKKNSSLIVLKTVWRILIVKDICGAAGKLQKGKVWKQTKLSECFPFKFSIFSVFLSRCIRSCGVQVMKYEAEIMKYIFSLLFVFPFPFFLLFLSCLCRLPNRPT